MADKLEDSAMAKVRRHFEKSGLSLHDLGVKMGYEPGIARQSAWQFMKTGDPRVSMLQRFAVATGVPMEELMPVIEMPVHLGLRLILAPLNDIRPLLKEAKEKVIPQEMLKYLDQVVSRCQLFQRTCPGSPESFQLASHLKTLEKCQKMPRASQPEKESFVAECQRCLSRLRSKIEKLF
jgi:transcriptional regulator with XRE-family HTH domain